VSPSVVDAGVVALCQYPQHYDSRDAERLPSPTLQ
jgi:hypothetical protein